jgi:hypothetical protein
MTLLKGIITLINIIKSKLITVSIRFFMKWNMRGLLKLNMHNALKAKKYKIKYNLFGTLHHKS